MWISLSAPGFSCTWKGPTDVFLILSATDTSDSLLDGSALYIFHAYIPLDETINGFHSIAIKDTHKDRCGSPWAALLDSACCVLLSPIVSFSFLCMSPHSPFPSFCNFLFSLLYLLFPIFYFPYHLWHLCRGFLSVYPITSLCECEWMQELAQEHVKNEHSRSRDRDG